MIAFSGSIPISGSFSSVRVRFVLMFSSAFGLGKVGGLAGACAGKGGGPSGELWVCPQASQVVRDQREEEFVLVVLAKPE